MSQNPARELATIIQTWRSTTNRPAEYQRGLADEGDGWATQMRAAVLLVELERTLHWMKSAQGADVDVFIEALPKWRNVVFHFPHRWSQDVTGQEGLGLLRACAPVLDQHGRTDFDVQRLQSELADIAEVVDEDASLSPTLKLYVARLVAHVNGLLDVFETTGVFELAEALAQLQIFMDAAAFQTDSDDNRSKFSRFGSFLKHPFVNTSAAMIGGGGVAMLPMITGG